MWARVIFGAVSCLININALADGAEGLHFSAIYLTFDTSVVMQKNAKFNTRPNYTRELLSECSTDSHTHCAIARCYVYLPRET